MSRNCLIRNAGESAATRAAQIAAEAGEDLGLVQTAIELGSEKVSGGRIEDERIFGGVTFEAFDEPVFIGSAIAQLSGHVDAVVVDSLNLWATRLQQRFGDDQVELEAEVLSLVSVMKARMADLILLSDSAGLSTEDARILEFVEAQVRPLCDQVIE